MELLVSISGNQAAQGLWSVATAYLTVLAYCHDMDTSAKGSLNCGSGHLQQ